jgi:hypothetical protein
VRDEPGGGAGPPLEVVGLQVQYLAAVHPARNDLLTHSVSPPSRSLSSATGRRGVGDEPGDERLRGEHQWLLCSPQQGQRALLRGCERGGGGFLHAGHYRAGVTGNCVTPFWHHRVMATNQSALDFAHAARLLGREARRRGLVAPSYRCPPRIVGVQRSLASLPEGRRGGGGAAQGRPWLAVLGDMIEGVVVANNLRPPQADRLRTDLWQVMGAQAGGDTAAPSPAVRASAPATGPSLGRVA